MKSLLIKLSLLSLFLIGCKEEIKIDYATIEKEIEGVTTIDDKRSYLESIFKADQKVRGSHGSEIMISHGKDSKEYNEYVRKQITQDAINLVKVEKYFEKFGHPIFKEVGEIATITPWTVIHHAQTYKERERNFETFYKAYLEGHLNDGAISMFLGRMYEMKNRKRFQMESPYKSEDEINELIKKLNLQKKKANAQQSIKRQ